MKSVSLRIARHVALDILRSRVLLFFTAALFATGAGIFILESSPEKAILGLINAVLFVVPLFASIFTSLYLYNNTEFIQLVLVQPVPRNRLFTGLFAGIGGTLTVAIAGSLALTLLLFGAPDGSWLLPLVALALTLIFSVLALYLSIFFRDKTKGIGSVMLLWLLLNVVYDGIVLLVVLLYADYPLETVTLVLISLNPIDLARIFLLHVFDVSAIMGFTGQFFLQFFGSALGPSLVALALSLWFLFPAFFVMKHFRTTDW